LLPSPATDSLLSTDVVSLPDVAGEATLLEVDPYISESIVVQFTPVGLASSALPVDPIL